MKREELEHVVRAAADIVEGELVVIGSQASAHDLVLAKLAAGRSHDLEFAVDAVREELVDAGQLELGVELMHESQREVTRERLASVLARSERRP